MVLGNNQQIYRFQKQGRYEDEGRIIEEVRKVREVGKANPIHEEELPITKKTDTDRRSSGKSTINIDSSSSNNNTNGRKRVKIPSGQEKVIRTVAHRIEDVKSKADITADHTGPHIVVETKPVFDAFINLQKRGIVARYITEIREDNLEYCKQMSKIVHLRHFNGLNANFSLLDGQTYYTPTISQLSDYSIPMFLRISPKGAVDQHQYFFDTLWRGSTPAEQRINEIERAARNEFQEIIKDRAITAQKIVEITRSIKKEAQVLLPTAASLERTWKIGMWENLIHAAEGGAEIRVLCPISKVNADRARQLSSYSSNLKILNGEPAAAGFVIIDRERYIRSEIIQPDAAELEDAIGPLEYSNSKSGIESIKVIFDVLWKQTDLYRELSISDAMQKEFIDKAAHELRTPIQPILGLAQVLRDRLPDEENRSLMDVIIRNAKRLIELEERILDATTIESNSLDLNRERVELRDILNDVVTEYENKMAENSDVKLSLCIINPNARESSLYSSDSLTPTSSEHETPLSTLPFGVTNIDKQKISEVISNLLDNSIKSTKKGSITIMVSKTDSDIAVKVRDTGAGINKDFMPNLFSKFASNSPKGMGLGLFVSKKIVEAHGGRIWAENNKDGKGATFTFTLPLVAYTTTTTAITTNVKK